MKYNKVYFLHIPKTGGRFLTKYILEPISDQLKQNGIELIKLPDNVLKHGGWNELIDDNTYIVSVFRDPVKFFVSALSHMLSDEKGLIDKENNFALKDNNQFPIISVSEIYSVLPDLPYLKNFQSQNFILDPKGKSIMHASMNAHDKGLSIDVSLLYERIKRVNLMIRHNDLKNMDYSLLIKKIGEDLGVNLQFNLDHINQTYFKNNSSEILYNKLNQADKDFILKSFDLDIKVYKDNSLFWTPSN